MDEWPGRYGGVNLPMRTKSAACSAFVLLWPFFCAHVCEGAHVIWRKWILPGLREIVCARRLEKLCPGRPIPLSAFFLPRQLTALSISQHGFYLQRPTTAKVHHPFFFQPSSANILLLRCTSSGGAEGCFLRVRFISFVFV